MFENLPLGHLSHRQLDGSGICATRLEWKFTDFGNYVDGLDRVRVVYIPKP